MEEDLQWKMTSNGRRPPMEDDLQWKTSSIGGKSRGEYFTEFQKIAFWKSFLVLMPLGRVCQY
jgi:hypothetical protein